MEEARLLTCLNDKTGMAIQAEALINDVVDESRRCGGGQSAGWEEVIGMHRIAIQGAAWGTGRCYLPRTTAKNSSIRCSVVKIQLYEGKENPIVVSKKPHEKNDM
jgi:hypothetical protein